MIDTLLQTELYGTKREEVIDRIICRLMEHDKFAKSYGPSVADARRKCYLPR